jgi:catechol 2,3-dioxygenase-like lactoylglutathione lyase family enzyme
MDRMRHERSVGRLRGDVEIGCSNLDSSCRFYSMALGFRLISKDADSAAFDGDGHRLILRPHGHLDSAGLRAKQTGISIEVESLHDEFESLLAGGAEFSSRPCRQPWGSVMVNLFDPDRNRIMLVQRRSDVRDWRHAPRTGDALAA